MNEQQLYHLLDKYRNGQATASERQQLLDWYRSRSEDESIFPDEEDAVEKRMLARLHQTIDGPSYKRFVIGRWVAAAAVLMVVASAGWFLWPSAKQPQLMVQNKPAPIVPGSNKAVLTIGNKHIVLNNAKNGLLTKGHQVTVTKTSDGKLVYQAAADESETITQNTLTTPRGGEYQVVLPDGTHIWLNAATSLSYPSRFVGKERIVKLSGEAYFEVVKNPAMPFKVDVDGKQQVEVLGTHFNINAYNDNPDISTTLLEGSVKLSAAGKQAYLKPGQTGVNDFRGPFVVKPADVQEAMAWRNGLFVFHEQNIVEVMKTISRWYDVDVELKGEVKSKAFGGVTSRYKDLKEFLEVLKLSGGVRYQVQGRRVIIMD